eukprot:gene10332-biopygen12305
MTPPGVRPPRTRPRSAPAGVPPHCEVTASARSRGAVRAMDGPPLADASACATKGGRGTRAGGMGGVPETADPAFLTPVFPQGTARVRVKPIMWGDPAAKACARSRGAIRAMGGPPIADKLAAKAEKEHAWGAVRAMGGPPSADASACAASDCPSLRRRAGPRP